jgi:hypothetical protein
MKDVMQYKNFIGSLHFNANDEIFCGKIEGINDLVTFEGESVKKLKSAGLSSPTSVFSSLSSVLCHIVDYLTIHHRHFRFDIRPVVRRETE